MKKVDLLFLAIITCSILSCSTDSEERNSNINPALIQHDWKSISQRIVMRNGETHLLLCDSVHFKDDGKFIISYTGLSGNVIKDSSAYQLQADNETLKFYAYENGILNSEKSEISKIKVLNNH